VFKELRDLGRIFESEKEDITGLGRIYITQSFITCTLYQSFLAKEMTENEFSGTYRRHKHEDKVQTIFVRKFKIKTFN
jgi:hypothetical protein